jgi:hypothetical protein
MMTIGSNVQPRSKAKAMTARAKALDESVSKPQLKPFLGVAPVNIELYEQKLNYDCTNHSIC